MTVVARCALAIGASVTVAVCSSACAADSADSPAIEMRTDTLGDTVIVETVAGSVWGGPRSLVPELVIGREDGDPQALMGEPWGLAFLAGGRVAVHDVMVEEVLQFRSDGTLRGKLGEKGEGPGEYSRITGIAGLPDGTVAIHDGGQNKFMVFDTSGALLRQWPCPVHSFFVDKSLSTDDHGSIVLRFPVAGDPGGPVFASSRIGLVRFSPQGQVLDSVEVPSPENPRLLGWPLFPKRFAYWHPHGFVVAGTTEHYSMDLLFGDGRVMRIQRAWVPVSVEDEEWEILDEIHRYMERRWHRSLPDVPKIKPPISRVIISRTGEVWVQRHTVAVRVGPRPPDVIASPSPWQEPLLLDVFSVDGRFLGSVTGRTRMEILGISSDTVWASLPGSVGEPLVVRFRASPVEG